MTQDNNNYVAAWHDYKTDKVIVLERDADGKMYRKRYNSPYYFYVPDDEGSFTSIFGDKLSRHEFESKQEFDSAKNSSPVRFESDFTPLKRILMDVYYKRPAPPIYYAFLDIEVDYAQKLGFAGPTNPYAIINAVTVYQSWTGKFLTGVVPPMVDVKLEDGSIGQVRWTEIPGNNLKKLYAEIDSLIAAKELREGFRPEIVIYNTESELLQFMLNAIVEADIISGWNSTFYDIPYIAERLLLLGGEQLLQRLEHVGVRAPRKEMVNRFGTEEPIYKFQGRSHLDYMELFKKFTFEGRVSYALGNILQEEVGVGKLDFDGTLEELYHNAFPKFVAYNFRDVDGLVQLDSKFKFMAIANQMAHENTVNFDAVLGTVSYVETGIANHAHYELNKIVPDKNIIQNKKVEGAIVLTPTIGLHQWIGSVDINSLYPNTIRSLNISPEKIIGQFETHGTNDEKEQAWKDIAGLSYDSHPETKHTLFLESGEQLLMTGSEWKQLIIDNRWAISAYGTVFDQSCGKGVVADILGYWYDERKRLQAEKKKYAKLAKAETDPLKKAEYEKLEEQYDLLQLTKKISMNSLYGALLNAAFRFGDERMGASTTGTGRAITTHMMYTIEELATGKAKRYAKVLGVEKIAKSSGIGYSGMFYMLKRDQWDKNRKLFLNKNAQPPEDFEDFEAIIYGDTDSAYFHTKATNKADAVLIADEIAKLTNDTFPKFMRDAFNCQPEFDQLIKAGREVVGERALFQAKKKYIIKVVDLEGFAVDKMKSMGSEIKKADTPKIIQKFLKETVDKILSGDDYSEVATFVNQQRRTVLKNKLNVFELGVAKQVNNLDKYTAEYLNPGSMTVRNPENGKDKKLTITGQARAACNYNFLLDTFEPGAKPVSAGDKILIYCLKPNDFGFKTIGFPAEISHFPKWFLENFTVDINLTEEKMFDSKLEGIFSALGKDVPSPQSVLTNSIMEF
jgi:DNA polymerase elongation subunit (family B)